MSYRCLSEASSARSNETKLKSNQFEHKKVIALNVLQKYRK